jgi:colicin import membrane protein
MAPHDRPHRPRRPRGRWTALALAIAVNLVFLAVLIVSVSWQNRKPEPVTAELYAPPAKAVVAEPPPPPPPPPKTEPPPEPKVEPKPPPPVEQPDPRQAEIAQKAKAEALRKEKERTEQQRKEAEAKTKEEKRQADLRDRQQREVAAMRAQAERETQSRTQAEREAQLRALAERESRDRAQQGVADSRNRSQADWMDKIRAKVKNNVIEPPDLPGNPEAIFEVVLLPTGEVIDVQLRKSSGVRAYDDAVSRAILKSSPLPRPDRPEVFARMLRLQVRPRD